MNENEQKQKNGWPCKYQGSFGGDAVPYGGGLVHLPTYDVCDSPTMDEISDEEVEAITSCKDCPYYEPDPDFRSDESRYEDYPDE